MEDQFILDSPSNNYSNANSWILGISKSLERAAYYGMRSILILYMLSDNFNIGQAEAFEFYGYFTGGVILANIIGGLLGDLVLGNKPAFIIGGVLQSLGCFALMIPNSAVFYIAVILIAAGGGLYAPNVLAQLGKGFLNRPSKLDSIYTAFYLAINLGALLGPILIGFIGEDFQLGFALTGSTMLFSTLISTRYNDHIQTKKSNPEKRSQPLVVIAVLTFLGFFWMAYEASYQQINHIQENIVGIDNPEYIMSGAVGLTMLLCLVAAITWNKINMNPFLKIALGFLIMAASFFLFYLIKTGGVTEAKQVFYLSLILMSVAEVLIAPIVFSIITQYADEQYHAITMGFIGLPAKVLTFFFMEFFAFQLGVNYSFLMYLAIAMLICAVIFIPMMRNNPNAQEETDILY